MDCFSCMVWESVMEKDKKILYIVRFPLNERFNLQQKFYGQMSAFKNLGFDVYYIGFDEKHLYLVNDGEKRIIGNTHFSFPSYLHTLFYNDLHKAAVKAIKSVGFDYVYWRAAPIWNSSCKLAKVINEKNTKLIYEIPTFSTNREADMSFLRKLYTVYSKGKKERFSKYVDYYVVIGEDAKGTYKGKPAINIENGIDVGSMQARTPRDNEGKVHILALASMCYWHGYDRLIKSLAEYKGDYDVIIHMVGGNDGGCLNEWKQLASDLKLDKKVIFHNAMFGKDLDAMVDSCDLGAASLGRKDFKFISELKTREYIARGLPFIMAVDDVVLSKEKEKYWIKISNDDAIPNMERIVDFALEMRKRENLVGEMRAFAAEKLSWDAQYEKMFSIIENRD